ncbi:MAG: hypothetical protein LBN43_03895 [Oscillospiraceae bacterium]|jgi:hypothetical protein|nr:hypothetical protein [Oscillospiraceae bacterium]
MQKKVNFAKINVIIFIGFIAALVLAGILIPNREFSERENRVLAKSPKFSFSALFSGQFMTDYEKYVSDQFAMRDSWITLKAASEVSLGKTENNSVYFAKYGMLIERFKPSDTTIVDSNLRSLGKLSENMKELDIPVYFALIPGAVSVWSDLLPDNAPNDDQSRLITDADVIAGGYAQVIDVRSVLNEHKDEQIFYRTDHHWTGLGAYYGYAATVKAMGLTPAPKYEPVLISGSFYGTTYSTSGAGWVKPDEMFAYVPIFSVAALDYNTGKAVPSFLYNPEALSKKDKYAYFLGGNSPQRRIITGLENGGKLLILRDSYMDIELPYLLPHFEEIHLIDLRYFKKSIKEYAAENGIDSVLVSYSVKEFAEDKNLFLMEY